MQYCAGPVDGQVLLYIFLTAMRAPLFAVLAAHNKNVKEETAQQLLNHHGWEIRAGADDKIYYLHSQVDVFFSIGCGEDPLMMIMCDSFPELSLPGNSFSSVLPQKPNPPNVLLS